MFVNGRRVGMFDSADARRDFLDDLAFLLCEEHSRDYEVFFKKIESDSEKADMEVLIQFKAPAMGTGELHVRRRQAEEQQVGCCGLWHEPQAKFCKNCGTLLDSGLRSRCSSLFPGAERYESMIKTILGFFICQKATMGETKTVLQCVARRLEGILTCQELAPPTS